MTATRIPTSTQRAIDEAAELDATTATEEQVDSALFPLWAERYKFNDYARNVKLRIAATIFPKARVTMSHSSMPLRPEFSVNFVNSCGDLARYEEMLDMIEAATAPLDAEYEGRGGWQRYVLCVTRKAKAGHLHRMGCSTLRVTTECLIVAAASGLDADQVVGKFGETACTKCFPDAPVAR